MIDIKEKCKHGSVALREREIPSTEDLDPEEYYVCVDCGKEVKMCEQ